MSKNLPPLNWLRSFEACARHSSFTRAADELGISQSAISQQIQALETRLKAPLFIRKGRGITLTSTGRELLPRVSFGISQIQSVFDELAGSRDKKKLVVSVSNSIFYNLIAPRLDAFIAICPEVQIRFMSNIWADENLRHISDVDIRFSGESYAADNATRLEPGELIIVKKADGRGLLNWEEIQNSPLVETLGSADRWLDYCDRLGLKTPKPPKIEVDHYGAALNLAENGQSLALVNRIIAEQALHTKRIELAFMQTAPASSGYYLQVNSPDNEAALQFADWVMCFG